LIAKHFFTHIYEVGGVHAPIHISGGENND